MTATAMPAQLQSLQCPACGHPGSDIVGEHAFGAKIHCRACGTTSALVTNRQVHVQKTGDRACGDCGRTNPPRTRFCQCGRDLLRECRRCREAFCCDDKVCPHCGWDHDPSLDGEEVMNQRAAALNEALDQRRYQDLGRLEEDLLTAFLQRKSLTQSAERALKRLLLSVYEHGHTCGQMNRWNDEPGMAEVDRWRWRVEMIHERREQLADALEPGGALIVPSWAGNEDRVLDRLAGSSSSALNPSWISLAAGIFLWIQLTNMDLPGWGFLLAVILSALAVVFHNQGQGSLTEKLKQAQAAAETQWQAWLNEYDIPPRPSSTSPNTLATSSSENR